MLRNGRVVALPSETVYGLAANATDVKACREIFRAKRRPLNDPLIVHVASKAQARSLTIWNETAEALAKEFWPGALTLVLPKRPDKVPDLITAGNSTVAVRLPGNPLLRKVVKLAGCPLAAPSANPFGYISPTSAGHVKEGLDGRIPAILDGGECSVGVESTIVDVTDPARVRLLRPGGVSAHDLKSRAGVAVVRPRQSVSKSPQQMEAPGMLAKHYSPRTPTFVHRRLPRGISRHEAAISFKNKRMLKTEGSPHVIALSKSGDGAEAARQLYRLMRKLDKQGLSAIHLEKLPQTDAWAEALNDRMSRAAAQSGS